MKILFLIEQNNTQVKVTFNVNNQYEDTDHHIFFNEEAAIGFVADLFNEMTSDRYKKFSAFPNLPKKQKRIRA